MKNTVHFFIRLWIKVTSRFFFDKIKISGLENLPHDSPVIFACNHPNAFLDSIVMTTCAQRPLYYTARGDFFKFKLSSFLLRYINILPVFRREEGRELMYKNDETFSYSIEIFKRNGALVIFSEGLSENKWELRPLRKGTARLAYDAWNNPEIGDKLKVVPVAIHYSSWLKMRPVVWVEFLKNIEKSSFEGIEEGGVFNKKFNEQLKTILSEKCIVVDANDDIATQNKMVGYVLKNFVNGVVDARKLQNKYLNRDNREFNSEYKSVSDFLIETNISYDLKLETGIMRIINLICWFFIYTIAFVHNFIPYCLSKAITWKSTKGNDFHDSLLYCVLMLVYPIYLITLFIVIVHFIGLGAGLLAVFLATYTAYYYEAAKRYILSNSKRKKLVVVHDKFKHLFGKDND